MNPVVVLLSLAAVASSIRLDPGTTTLHVKRPVGTLRPGTSLGGEVARRAARANG